MTDDHTDRLRREADEVTAKIDASYEKLATKFRAKADKAKSALETKKGEGKRAVLQRRFDLYADAAHDIEHRLAERQRRDEDDGD